MKTGQFDLKDAFREQEMKAWKLDPEESRAYIVITPIIFEGERRFDISETLEIRPYPNPFSFGGFYGSRWVNKKEEAERCIKNFLEYVEKWKPRGLCQIEVKWEEEMSWENLKRKRTAKMLGQLDYQPELA